MRPGNEAEESSKSTRPSWNSVSQVFVICVLLSSDHLLAYCSKRFTNNVYGTKVNMYFTPTYEPFPFPTSMTVMYEA